MHLARSELEIKELSGTHTGLAIFIGQSDQVLGILYGLT